MPHFRNAAIIIRGVTSWCSAGLSFLFKPNFEVFKGTGWITVLAAAGGQVFFSLSLGMGIPCNIRIIHEEGSEHREEQRIYL